MKQLLHTLQQKLSTGQDLVLATITATSGATPRGAGARMLVSAEGRLCGTIGGGAVEHRAEQIAQEVLQRKASCEHSFSLTKDDVQDLGMVCGGNAQVFFQYLSAEDAGPAQIALEALTLLDAGADFWLVSDLAAGGQLSLFTKDTAPEWLRPHLKRQPKQIKTPEHDLFIEQIGVSGTVYLLGGGHVAQALAPVLQPLGFRCVVIDDRPEFADRTLFPTVEQVLCADFDRLDDAITVTPADYVCIMTRGHAHDTVAAAQLLPRHPRYLGMIGSRRKHATVCQTLRETYGFSDEDIASIVSPIGLPIQAETPAEIAISIAAQMIAVRATA